MAELCTCLWITDDDGQQNRAPDEACPVHHGESGGVA